MYMYIICLVVSIVRSVKLSVSTTERGRELYFSHKGLIHACKGTNSGLVSNGKKIYVIPD